MGRRVDASHGNEPGPRPGRHPRPDARPDDRRRRDGPARVGVTVTDALGRVVLTRPEQAAEGSVHLDLSGLPAGIYAVSLTVVGTVRASSRVAVVR